MPGYHLPPITIHRRLSAAELGEQLGYQITDYLIDQLWQSSGAGDGVIVGICDTGISAQHAADGGDLAGAVIAAKDFTNSRFGSEDVHGHGTHVAGIIAARSRNGKGIGGLAPNAKLAIAKVLGDNGSGSDEAVASGIRWNADQGAKVINCSLGGGGRSAIINAAIAYANSQGAIVVCAAGNEGGRVGYPAAEENNLCVGAIDASKVLADFSNRGNEVDFVSAPGVEILSTYARGGYAVLSGTSMATPWLSGLLALLIGKLGRSFNPAVDAVRQLLADAAIDLGPAGKDVGYGWGVPSPEKALTSPAETEPEPEPNPAPGTPIPSGQWVKFHGPTFSMRGVIEAVEETV